MDSKFRLQNTGSGSKIQAQVLKIQACTDFRKYNTNPTHLFQGGKAGEANWFLCLHPEGDFRNISMCNRNFTDISYNFVFWNTYFGQYFGHDLLSDTAWIRFFNYALFFCVIPLLFLF